MVSQQLRFQTNDPMQKSLAFKDPSATIQAYYCVKTKNEIC